MAWFDSEDYKQEQVPWRLLLCISPTILIDTDLFLIRKREFIKA